MKRIFSVFYSLLLFQSFLFSQVQSPDEFFPHKIGEAFTSHHLMVDYFEYVAENSDRVKLVKYGESYEGRPLMLAYISSAENIKNLEKIRMNNLALAGMNKKKYDPNLKVGIVWLSFSIHGNEAAGAEASHQVLYDLINPENADIADQLEHTLVIMEPSVNPDGYSRYTHWQKGVAPVSANANFDDIEHHEPWPGGRTNHYYFDLNRDWAWQTQVESQLRMEQYNDWLPHILADLHEMGHNSHYFFAPAAKPMHDYITDWQKDFQMTIGKNHAQYFDQNGWLYFTKEVYDLFYPSYGDTYPSFNGAIGMTYEQGGSGRGGRAVETSNGEVLTLKDRIDHHVTSALSTIEVCAAHTSDVLENFQKFFKESKANPPGAYRTYIIPGNQPEANIKALTSLLDKQKIIYGTTSSSSSLKGYNYTTGIDESFNIQQGDLIIPAKQSKAVLTQVLFEPESRLEDSLTYDITAWSLPYAYGLDAYAITTDLSMDDSFELTENVSNKLKNAYAYIVKQQGQLSDQFIGRLLLAGVTVKRNDKEIRVGTDTFAPGSYIITKGDNRSKGELIPILEEARKNIDLHIHHIQSGFVDEGFDLGSNSHSLVKQPKVICLNGPGISANAFGQVKYYFDQILKYPITVVEKDRFSRINLDNYNTLILPNGRYRFSDSQEDNIQEWVDNGGKVIAIGNSTRAFADKNAFALKSYIDDSAEQASETENRSFELAARYQHYSDLERASIASYIPGAIVKLKMDTSHPLAFGLKNEYFSLKTNSISYPLMVDAANVGYIEQDPTIIGFMGHRAKKKLPDTFSFAVEEKGSGKVIYMVDDPLFRCFWYNGFRLFTNAIFL